MREYAVRLVRAMQRKGVTTAELSRRTGITRNTIYQYRLGYREPKYSVYIDICRALDVPVQDF